MMPKYLVQASYVGQGLKGLIKEGGTSRLEPVTRVIEGITDVMTRWPKRIGE